MMITQSNTSESYIGQFMSQIFGVEKVTGKAIFTTDLVFPGMLYAALKSPIPHGRMIRTDTSKAEKCVGSYQL
jgi:CO/xanthine dehydrogenase Mo-binding subunit